MLRNGEPLPRCLLLHFTASWAQPVIRKEPDVLEALETLFLADSLFLVMMKQATPIMSNHDSHESASSNEGQPDRHLHKPFAGWSKDRLMTHVAGFIQKSGLEDYEPHFVRGALLAQRKTAFDATRKDGLTLDDRTRKAIDLENSKRRIDLFKQPAKLYALVACCSLGAAVQGWFVKLEAL